MQRPVVLSSIASESPGKTRHENQTPLSPQTEKYDRTVRPVENAHSSSYSEWNIEKTWSSQEWKFDELVDDRTGRPVVSAHSTRTISLLKTMRRILTPKQSQTCRWDPDHSCTGRISSKDATKDSDKHSVIWRMFMSSTLQASVFMGKNYSDNWHSITNTEDLTTKQMFDISEKLISEQSDEIYGVKTINWEDSSWKYLSLIGDEEVISLLHTKVHAFSDSVLCLGKMNENPQSTIAWEDRLTWFNSSSEYRALDRIVGEPMEFDWNIFPGFTTLQVCHKVQEFMSKKEQTTRRFHWTDYLHVDVQRHLMGI